MQAYYNPREGIRLGRDLSRQSLPKWEELKRTNAARRRQEMHREYSVLSAFRDLRSKVSRGPEVRIFRVSVQNPTEACQLLRCLAKLPTPSTSVSRFRLHPQSCYLERNPI